jgi:disulfide bond formation protein DsbB
MLKVKSIERNALYFAFVQAWIATLGSLYLSEVLHWRPCILCWYQRILMYPLIIILGVAILRKDKNVVFYVLPMTIFGAAIALYHYLLQMTPLPEIAPVSCSAFGPCRETETLLLGFVTIPFLSLTAFLVISAMMIIIYRSRGKT